MHAANRQLHDSSAREMRVQSRSDNFIIGG
jgi:hypothetical protein